MQPLVDQQSSLQDQALAWVACLRGGNTDVLDDFSAWLCASPEHLSAWNDALELWETLGVLSHIDTSALMEKPSNAVAPIASRSRWFRFSSGAIAATVMLAATLLVYLPQQQSGEVTEYVALHGEINQFALEDGSTLFLNSQSLANTLFTEDERRINLLEGEGFFDVAPDPSKPFVVSTGSVDVVAVGTAFSVNHVADNQIEVIVSEGVVKLRETQSSPAQAASERLVQAGEQASYTPETGISQPTLSQPDVDLAWRNGQVVFSETPLKQVANSLNRYLDKPVHLGSNDVANVELSGVYSAKDSVDTLEAIAATLSLQLTEQPNNWLLSKATP